MKSQDNKSKLMEKVLLSVKMQKDVKDKLQEQEKPQQKIMFFNEVSKE